MTELSKQNLLKGLDVGRRIAEEELEHLSGYFVETDQWARIYQGEVDVIYGPKGSGKSAIYATLLSRRDQLFDRSVVVESAEKPQGTPAFQDLVADPPTSEREFVGLWKLYFLTLVLRVFREYGISNDPADRLRASLEEIGLAPEGKPSLRSLIKDALAYVRRVLSPESIEATMHLDPHSGSPTGLSTKVTLGEPTADERAAGFTSIEELLHLANEALDDDEYTLWILLDRLDVAFAENEDLERNALRALFKVYLDLLQLPSLSLKIFLRTDIWRSITQEGFREASHITRTITISWNQPSLLNLTMRRFLQSEDVLTYYRVSSEGVLASADSQEALFYRMFPDQVDTGRNPRTFGWMLGRTTDGSGLNAPRELIHLLSTAREEQLKELELGGPEPPDENLFTRSALRTALPEVSRVRLEQTLYAENPALKPRLEALSTEKTTQYPETLASIWGVDDDEASRIAGQLVEVGFFESVGSKESPSYRVPFLYRPALNMVQGSAEA